MTQKPIDRRFEPDRREYSYTQHIPERRVAVRRCRWTRETGEGYLVCSKCGRELSVSNGEVWNMESDTKNPETVIILCKNCYAGD